ncbi:hypothetical protein [Domibacillus tundrae]|uniref:hypothetical protein n=1 Tax=Domibacillus tundrae TaxID=1587527 RepID=UPI003398285B
MITVEITDLYRLCITVNIPVLSFMPVSTNMPLEWHAATGLFLHNYFAQCKNSLSNCG